MSKCYFEGCNKEATTTVYRLPREDEQEFDEGEHSINLVAIVENYVCEDDLEEARKEYPLLADRYN